MPTGWARISEFSQTIQTDSQWLIQQFYLIDDAWLSYVAWLFSIIGVALRDEGRLISENMKHLLYEVPVKLLGQSAGYTHVNEDDIPVIIYSWKAQNLFITILHVKGSAKDINVLVITEVQEQLLACGYMHHAQWDYILFWKLIFDAADEVELMFVKMRNKEDLSL
ncbi:hypothetical protein H5410_062387 [Solanum commersonii]|uniref:Uncharacterized protein n=1 Tax=Solanum commersonii TaxID=4109 RepID=A0A9J5WAQ2_SOLCO|nr:hypothetical protein H5410_062387 [Solanum commersonii]